MRDENAHRHFKRSGPPSDFSTRTNYRRTFSVCAMTAFLDRSSKVGTWSSFRTSRSATVLWRYAYLPVVREISHFPCVACFPSLRQKFPIAIGHRASPSEINARGAHAIAHWFLELFSSKFHTRYLHVRLHLADMLKSVIRTF